MSTTPIDIKPPGHIDHLPLRGMTMTQLNLDAVTAHVERARASGRYIGPSDALSYLRERQCLVATDEGELVTTAGLLCFGRNPQATFPNAIVDIGQYYGLVPVSAEVVNLEKDIGGTVIEQFTRVEQYLWSNIHHGMTLNDTTSVRIEIHQYPRIVLRELTINALAHRKYHEFPSAVRIHLLRDRIEWISPGGLPEGVTVDNLLDAQFSRNPTLVRVLYDAGLVEKFGQGLDTVVDALGREGFQPPVFTDAGSFFKVGVLARPAEQLFGSAYEQLTIRQRRILDFIRTQQSATPGAVEGLFAQTVTTRSLQRDVKVLEEAGMIVVIRQGRGTYYHIHPEHSHIS